MNEIWPLTTDPVVGLIILCDVHVHVYIADAPEEVGYGNHGDMMEEEVVKEEVESDYDHMDNSDDDDDFSDVGM